MPLEGFDLEAGAIGLECCRHVAHGERQPAMLEAARLEPPPHLESDLVEGGHRAGHPPRERHAAATAVDHLADAFGEGLGDGNGGHQPRREIERVERAREFKTARGGRDAALEGDPIEEIGGSGAADLRPGDAVGVGRIDDQVRARVHKRLAEEFPALEVQVPVSSKPPAAAATRPWKVTRSRRLRDRIPRGAQ